MTVDVEQEFRELCRQADALDWATDNNFEVEPSMVALIDLVKRQPDQRTQFVELFSDVDDGTIAAPVYLVPFCMRELRFPELRAKLERELRGDRSTERFLRRMNYISDVMHAFDDEVWEGADFWPYYAHKLNQ